MGLYDCSTGAWRDFPLSREIRTGITSPARSSPGRDTPHANEDGAGSTQGRVAGKQKKGWKTCLERELAESPEGEKVFIFLDLLCFPWSRRSGLNRRPADYETRLQPAPRKGFKVLRWTGSANGCTLTTMECKPGANGFSVND